MNIQHTALLGAVALVCAGPSAAQQQYTALLEAATTHG